MRHGRSIGDRRCSGNRYLRRGHGDRNGGWRHHWGGGWWRRWGNRNRRRGCDDGRWCDRDRRWHFHYRLVRLVLHLDRDLLRFRRSRSFRCVLIDGRLGCRERIPLALVDQRSGGIEGRCLGGNSGPAGMTESRAAYEFRAATGAKAACLHPSVILSYRCRSSWCRTKSSRWRRSWRLRRRMLPRHRKPWRRNPRSHHTW